ncbi:metallophosphoesterase [Plantactinospora sp. GCM10030261]|uniref:metallophosphoesterase n=1 Tax=Plantactinospora sp. GCM10030261 TaxID=3273420 RepID=UPI00360EC018
MRDGVRLRIGATNDLLGSFHPWPTGYGSLPGGAAIRATVDQLRAETPAVWIDAGDFAQGGAISTLTDGYGGFTAMDSLGPDVVVAGNHEFDWGTPHLRSAARRISAPMLCANHPDSGLPATAMLDASGVAVGVVGCTTPDLFRLVREPATELITVAEATAEGVHRLRADGADVVVAAVHDGVDWRPDGNGARQLPRRFADQIGAWQVTPDLIVAGHTLGRWIGRLHGIPVLQPWAFGAEIGIAEFDRNLAVSRLTGRVPTPCSDWTGFGADLVTAAAGRLLGHLPHTLVNRPGSDHSLPRYVAAAIARRNGTDGGVFGCWEMATGQPPVDGAVAFLAAGPVSEADVLRLVPYQDDSVVRTVITEREFDRLRRRKDLACWSVPDRRGTVGVAITRYSSVDLAAHLDRHLEFEPAAAGVRDSLRRSLEEGVTPECPL